MGSRIVRDPAAFNTSRRAKETEAVKSAPHLDFIRSLPSVLSGRSPCEAAHINFADRRYGKPERGKGTKADDCWTLPLTAAEHRDGPNAQHRTGNEERWWTEQGIDACALAARLWAVSGDFEAGTLIVETARVQARPKRN